jgi:hypothetical protein
MIDGQELPGASASPEDAPSLSTARSSGRQRKATQKLVDSQREESRDELRKPVGRSTQVLVM